MGRTLTKQDYIDYIKLTLSGDLIELEIPDETIGKYVDQALIELQRYINETKLITVPYARCIDLEGFDHSSIVNVYRTVGFTGDTTQGITTSESDPLYAQTWSVFSSGGNMYNLQNYVMNYMSYTTLLQIRNNLSTDLSFREDKQANKLYINVAYDHIDKITIEYIPVFRSVEEIKTDYWIDILKQLSLALVKYGLGRIRTRFTQGNAIWTQDGEQLLTEGREELQALRERLNINDSLFYPMD